MSEEGKSPGAGDNPIPPPANEAATPVTTILPEAALQQILVTPPVDPGERRPEFVAVAAQLSAEVSSSPFPPPEMLHRYNELVPGVADRLVAMIEQESKHRRTLEGKRQEAEIADMKAQRYETRRGQWLGFWIGVVAIAGGVLASILGAPWSGGFIGTAGVVGLVSVFVLGRVRSSGLEKPGSEK